MIPMSDELAGFIYLYLIPFCATLAAAFLLRWLFRSFEARDVMDGFRPKPRHVNHTERLLRVQR